MHTSMTISGPIQTVAIRGVELTHDPSRALHFLTLSRVRPQLRFESVVRTSPRAPWPADVAGFLATRAPGETPYVIRAFGTSHREAIRKFSRNRNRAVSVWLLFCTFPVDFVPRVHENNSRRPDSASGRDHMDESETRARARSAPSAPMP